MENESIPEQNINIEHESIKEYITERLKKYLIIDGIDIETTEKRFFIDIEIIHRKQNIKKDIDMLFLIDLFSIVLCRYKNIYLDNTTIKSYLSILFTKHKISISFDYAY